MKKLYISMLLCAWMLHSSNSNQQSLESAFKRLTVSEQQKVIDQGNQAMRHQEPEFFQKLQQGPGEAFWLSYFQVKEQRQVAENVLLQEKVKDLKNKRDREKFAHWG